MADITEKDFKENLSRLNIPFSPMINAQMKKNIKAGLTYRDMTKALIYFLQIKGNEFKPEMGIGIVPLVVEEAKTYFKRDAERTNRQIASIKGFDLDNLEIIVVRESPNKPKKKNKTIDISILEVEEDDD